MCGLQVSGLGSAETGRRVRDAMASLGLEGYGCGQATRGHGAGASIAPPHAWSSSPVAGRGVTIDWGDGGRQAMPIPGQTTWDRTAGLP